MGTLKDIQGKYSGGMHLELKRYHPSVILLPGIITKLGNVLECKR